ncbi:threonine-phosphate decarboxylase CobD [Rhodobacteraceae bacterium HSP-20]|uniref:threonine-phosphate decarboxylase n=1 Tax=Paragemmobacter amnigenus TaxID=2852097 RepID=A0ABS6J8Z4_9RHOB|nr:threonine-phosphate decarboxylase CobD [Rhodobacter amnigenus]MBU9698952.1 threonine-phosphate decarboxylase CobD [Rhodobacter amnigenus]MBV4390179.1 threonine-phosphate decarboxylase CobD [Rhodobacter amnigenus]
MRDHGNDHGGNLDQAMAAYGAGDWIDLSTGINRRPWPLPDVPAAAWRNLPTRAAQAGLIAQAVASWGLSAAAEGVALGGAQAAIQLVPRLRPAGKAAVLGPTYNEHAACLLAEGWQVRNCTHPDDLRGADLAVIVNPNNPDGRSFRPETLLALAESIGLLVVDESFGDVTPELSLLPRLGQRNLLVLRSFGKFYGLAGLRLGFAFGAGAEIAALTRMSGPWPVSGPAIEIGGRALADSAWASAMRAQLATDAAWADALALMAGWQVAGGSTLFRLYDTANAALAQDRLAKHQIWSRIFPWSETLLRLGLPGPEPEWDRLQTALSGC